MTMASSSSGSLLAALSSSGSHVAVIVPSNANNSSLLRIQVFQTSNGCGTLQTTLTHRNNTTAASLVSAAQLPLEIFWAGDDKICVLTSQQQVLVFDLTRGVLAHTIVAKQPDQILHHAAASPCTTALSSSSSSPAILQVLVSSRETVSGSGSGGKIQIHEYDASSGNLLRKIKAGSRHDGHNDDDPKKNTVALGLAVTTDYVIVREGNQLRILKADTGEKVTKKCKLFSKKASSSSSTSSTDDDAVTTTVAAGQLGAAVVSAARQVVLVNLKTGKVTPTSTSLPASSSSSSGLQLWETTASSPESLYYYLYHDKVLYKLEATSDKDDDSNGKKHIVEVKSKRKIQANSSIEKQVVLGGFGDGIIAVLYKAGQIQVDKISLLSSSSDSAEEDDVVALTWSDSESADNNNTTASSSSSTKRKSTSGTLVLGPGQAGGEARTVSEGSAPKRAKKEGDDDEGDKDGGDDEDEDNQGPTIAERLQKLEEALNAEQDAEDADNGDEAQEDGTNSSSAIKFHPKKATTESLTLVLEQALQSNDKVMLELALTVTNKRILQATCESLQPESLSKLLSALTTRLAQKPTRAVQLSYWLTVVLKSGRIQNNNNNNIGQLLQPLRNLLEERVELFPTFYKLRGRLGMMGNLQE